MPLGHPSPLCTVNGGSTLNGADVTAGSTVTIAIADSAGVNAWSVRCTSTDELLVASTITAGLSVSSITLSATFTAPAAGSAMIFESKINGGLDINGNVDPSLTTTFAIFVQTTTGYRVGAWDEHTEGDVTFGWISKFNRMIRGVVINPASGGAGMSFSAGAYNIGAADGSIVVGTDDIRVGVISDTNHGTRGGGALHAAASGSAAGFMSAAHYSLVNGATAAATPSTLVKRDSGGSVAVVDLTATSVSTDTVLVNSVATFDGSVNMTYTLAVTGALSVGGTSSMHAVGITGALSVTGNTSLTGTLSCSGAVTIGIGGSLAVTSNTTLAALSCSGAVTMSSTLGVTGAVTCASTLAVTGNVTMAGTLSVTGTTSMRTITVGASGPSLGGGDGVVGVNDAATVPTTNPSGGGVLYSQGGALKWRGSSGTVTTIAPA